MNDETLDDFAWVFNQIPDASDAEIVASCLADDKLGPAFEGLPDFARLDFVRELMREQVRREHAGGLAYSRLDGS